MTGAKARLYDSAESFIGTVELVDQLIPASQPKSPMFGLRDHGLCATVQAGKLDSLG